MNDEDFAHQAFAAAFRSGGTGEPPTLPDVEGLASRGRRAARYRHGTYAAGTTALAGVVTAGIVTGPALLGLGTHSGSRTVTAGGGGSTTPAPTASVSVPDSPKPSPGVVPCTTSATINWLAVVSAALPSGVTATPDHSANCVQLPDGTRTYEALFTLSTGAVGLQVHVGTGPEIARKLGAGGAQIGNPPGSDSPSLDPSALASLRAGKLAAAAAAKADTSLPADVTAPSPSASLDAAAIASLEAQKRAFASAGATASPSPGDTQGVDLKPGYDGHCSNVSADENACVSHMTKGPLSVVDVQLMRTGSSPVVVDIAASNGKTLSTPAPEQLPSDATMVALAQAVAAHF